MRCPEFLMMRCPSSAPKIQIDLPPPHSSSLHHLTPPHSSSLLLTPLHSSSLLLTPPHSSSLFLLTPPPLLRPSSAPKIQPSSALPPPSSTPKIRIDRYLYYYSYLFFYLSNARRFNLSMGKLCNLMG